MSFLAYHLMSFYQTKFLSDMMMEEVTCSHIFEGLQERSCRQLSEALSALRNPEHSDVILICDDQEFYAHKLVLQASSPYFETMFNSGLDESQNGRIVFKDILPETLEAILDFIYQGSVEKIQTEDQMKKVLTSAHMMGLADLFQYCCTSLGELLSFDNLAEIKEIGKKYSNKNLQERVSRFSTAAKFATNKYFLLSVEAAKHFLKLGQGLFICVFITWLAFSCCVRESPTKQNSFFSDLLACINSDSKTQYECFNSLSKDSSIGATIRLHGNGIMRFVVDKCDQSPNSQPDSPAFSWKLTYYSDYSNVELYYPQASNSLFSHTRDGTYCEKIRRPALRWRRPIGKKIDQFWPWFNSLFTA